MRYLRYEKDGKAQFGVLDKANIRPVEGSIFGEHRIGEPGPTLAGTKLLPPVEPGAVYAIGLNYEKHIEEFKHMDDSRERPESPILFMCAPSAVIGPEASIVLENAEDPIHFEVELVVVIGKAADRVTAEEALDYVFGYTIGNDVSNRSHQKKDKQWFRAKSHPTFKPLGPWIETELDPSDLAICSKINGVVRQEGRTSDMIFSVPELIAHISSVTPLKAGDLIYTGTPEGVGPLKAGDSVALEIEGIGRLYNSVELKSDE